MRVLHLANHCHHGHGNVHLAVDLACIQAASGDFVGYASHGGEYEQGLSAMGAHHIKLMQRGKNPFKLAASLVSLSLLVRRSKYDIVHAHMMAGAIFGYFATRFSNARLVTTVHNSFDKHSSIMKLGDRIVAVSNSDTARLREMGFKKSKVDVVLNATLGGFRTSLLPDKAVFEKPPGILITTVCGLHARKGVNFLISAFAVLAAKYEVTLCVVGDGPDKDELERQAEKLGLSGRVRFLGQINNPATVLAKTDIFVLASLAEPLGLVNIEARSAGCAIVATEVGGIPEALDEGRAGFLVRPGDPKDLTEKLEILLRDPELLSQMKGRASSNLDRFSITNLYLNYSAVYGRALTRSAGSLGTLR
ncbi:MULTISPECIES: glycosyltransferase [Rhizobium]|uniref:Glycosyltransferase n=1 Tax=Rhizobium rhododendri TaxID=2506430 RepID=A0ABY8IN81_9HYPH|nr:MULTISPECIES: glycosyltransferase [Rhizobium]TQX86838.1 glycosyltransferase family 1 protein [Rhizobium sp. rho-13.1]WFS25052.1 glycosyltransferase [Rhizobium rhododendri]